MVPFTGAPISPRHVATTSFEGMAMRAALRGVLLVIGIVAGLLFISANGRSELTPAGRETTARIGAVGPWLEYTRTPQHMSYQFDVLSGSALFGVTSVGCFWLRSRLIQTSLSPAEVNDQPALAVEAGRFEAS